MANDDGWTVVGRAKPASSRAHATQPEVPQHPASASSDLQLPGWGYAESPKNARSRKNKGRKPLSFEERVSNLLQQISDCQSEVSRSLFYTRLKAAFDKTSALQVGIHSPDRTAHQHSQSAHTTQEQQLVHMEAVSSGTGREVVQGDKSCSSHWKHAVRQLVCFGLGSPSDSKTSKYQLALLLLLREDLLPGLTSQPQVYDPFFTDLDRAALQQLGCAVLEVNEECARTAQEPTFFFLPHLEGHMCDRLLQANITLDTTTQSQTSGQPGQQQHISPNTGCTLGNCILLANKFSTYKDRWDFWTPSRGVAAHAHPGHHQEAEGRPRRPDTMLALIAAGAVIQVDVEQEPNFPAPSAFNDTALHLFDTCALVRPVQ